MMISSLAMAGAERNVVSVAPHICNMGVDLHLVSMNTRRDSELADEFAQTGIPRLDLKATRMTDPNAWKYFTDILKEKQIDFIHAQDQDTIVYAALARTRLNIPAVMSRHVLDEPQDTLKEKMRAQMVLLAAKLGFDRIIAVSEAARHHFAEIASVPTEKIETIYNGLDLERFQVSTPKADLRRRLGWPQNAPVIVMVAAMRRGKGHEILFDAIPAIKAQVPDVQIKLVGEGEIEQDIQEQAAPYMDVVEFLGRRHDIPDLLAASDVLTLPSWAEALPTVLIEAGAASLPSVASDVGGAKEIIEDGITGYITRPGDVTALADKLVMLLTTPQHAQQLGQQALARVEKAFSLEKQAQETVDLYHRITNQ